MERILSKKGLMELCGEERETTEDWKRNIGSRMIEKSNHSKYITEGD